MRNVLDWVSEAKARVVPCIVIHISHSEVVCALKIHKEVELRMWMCDSIALIRIKTIVVVVQAVFFFIIFVVKAICIVLIIVAIVAILFVIVIVVIFSFIAFIY